MEPELESFIEELNRRFEKPSSQSHPLFEDAIAQDEFKAVNEIPYSEIDPALFNIDLSNGYQYINDEEEEEEEEEEEGYFSEHEKFSFESICNIATISNRTYIDGNRIHLDDTSNYVTAQQSPRCNIMATTPISPLSDGSRIHLDEIIRSSNNITAQQFPHRDSQFVYFSKPSVSRYEPKIFREMIIATAHQRNHKNKKRQLQGLCPYCPNIKFYEINSSAYLHHLTINHGIFSNGNVIKDPIIGSDGVVECPYDGCANIYIKLKRQDPSERFKAYCRHVKIHHYEGKNS